MSNISKGSKKPSKYFAKSSMTEEYVKEIYAGLKDAVRKEGLWDNKYISVKIEQGCIVDAFVGDLPKKGSGYFPIEQADKTPKFFTDEGSVEWMERIRTVLLSTFIYDVDVTNDALVKMMHRTLPKVASFLEVVIQDVRSGDLEDFIPYDISQSSMIKAEDIKRIARKHKEHTRLKAFVDYYDNNIGTKYKGLYYRLQEEGVDAYVESVAVGRTDDEFNDIIAESMGYINTMLFVLEAIQRHTKNKKH